MRRVTAIDVAGGDLRSHDIAVEHGQHRAVVGDPAHAIEITGASTVEHEHLPAAARRGQRLAVHADETSGLLDDAVRLAGDDVAVVAQPDVQRLSAATQRQVQVIGMIGGSSADRHAALELGDRATEGLAEIDDAVGDVSGHHGRDDLGVGGDRSGNAQTMANLDVGMVVDIAVQHGHHVRSPTGLLELFAVQRVAIGLTDDADAGPSRVPEDREPGVGLRQRQTQQPIGADRGAQRLGVVAEFADLGGRLVHEPEALACDPNRAVLEEGVALALAEHPLHGRIRHRQAVVPDEQVEPGRIATPHLETIECRQRLLHSEVAGDRRRAAVAPGQRLDLAAPCAVDRDERPRSASRNSINSVAIRSCSSGSSAPSASILASVSSTRASSWSSRDVMAAASS